MHFQRLKKLAVVCGGTGGHFYPGLSVARTFTAAGGESRLFLSGMHVTAQAEQARQYGLTGVALPVTRRPGRLSGYPPFAFDLARSFLLAGKALWSFRPDALLAMGSFASIAGVLAAKALGIPIYLHDGNARVGRANLYFSRWARHLATAYPPVNPEKIRCPHSWTGMPLRPELLGNEPSLEEAINLVNKNWRAQLRHDRPVILIFGGSQGAKTFNETLPTILRDRRRKDMQIIHLTGKGCLELVKKSYASAEIPALVLEQCEEMRILYAAATLVICRGGGSTIAELAHSAKFAIIVPFPHAADHHQDDNGRFYADTGAAVLVQDHEGLEKLPGLITAFLADPEPYRLRGMAGRDKARPMAASDLLSLIEADLA